MNRLFARLVFWVLVLVLVSGCQALTGRTLGQNLDDANLTGSVKARLIGYKASNFTRIDVDTNDGVVYLNGTVANDTDRERAEEIASTTAGVKRVVNNLQIQKP